MKKIVYTLGIFVFLLTSHPTVAQQVANVNAAGTSRPTEIQFSPARGSFQQGAVFEVPIYINTRGNKIGSIELHVQFDPDHLRITTPSGGTSIIGEWTAPPIYDNERGTLRIVGTIPNGMITDSGLIVTVTFQARAIGNTYVSIGDGSSVLLNDGIGSPTDLVTNHASFTILAKAPEGPRVTSDTHPISDRWYNNPNPILLWGGNTDASGFSYVFDTIRTTMPPNTVNATSTTASFQNVKDGVWYFHIKEKRGDVWDAPTHFAVRIDTVPPAEFTLNVERAGAAVMSRSFLSFFTTDNLSGIDHYEVGSVPGTESLTTTPVYITTESPHHLPLASSETLSVFVRAYDKAGNVREEVATIRGQFFLSEYVADNIVMISLALIALATLPLLTNYFFGHHIIRRLKRARELLKKEEEKALPPEDATPHHGPHE